MQESTSFRERLLPSPSIWAAAAVVAGLSGFVALPFGTRPAAVTVVVAVIVLILLLVNWSPVVSVSDGELVAGRAQVPAGLLGEITVLDATAMRAELGPRLDVRAYLCIRGWIKQGVRARLDDPEDPTPYWLISSRHPVDLAAALQQARAAADRGR